MTILCLGIMVGMGLQQAASTRVGQEIGKGNISEAKEYYLATKCVAALFFSIIIGLTYLFGDQLIMVFLNKDDAVISAEARRICNQMLIYCLLSKLGDYW